jgi:hypothetical protein
VWVEPLKTKSGLEVSNAFLKIIQQAIKDKHNPPKNLHADKGKEFYNKDMRIVLNKHNINLYSTGTKNKAFFVERFNRTLGNNKQFLSNLEILQHNQIASLKNYFLNRARDNIFFNALVSADKGYTPLNLSDNIISDIVEPNIPDTIANIKQKSLHGRYFKEL